MGWKILHLTKACKINIKSENLVLTFSDTNESIKVTIKDIDFILFDTTLFSITGKTLELLSKNNIATLFIDENFTPSGILTPYHKHSTMSEVAHTQISITTEFRQKVWQNIIKIKILNQAEVLKFFYIEKYKDLEDLSKKVLLYDKNNDEAQSARLYWKALFKDFKRSQGKEDIINSMLNFAYAVLRSYMARSVSASGLLPVFGLWHQNRYNAFNLVDDFIEPFRPICDLYVKLLLNKYPQKTILDIELKRELIALFNLESVLYNGVTTLSKTCEQFVINYKKAMFRDDESLIIYPKINTECFKNGSL
jgi:CRISPR-associated protein Cas1